jgi:hypothetical protein
MSKKQKVSKKTESDGVYFLKIVLYLILGSQWIRLVDSELTTQIPIPVGFMLGILFASHDHFKIDRKIEYAVLTVGAFVGFWLQTGFYIQLLK